MPIEQVLGVTRAIVLVGAVVFAFALLLFGMVIVLREYNLVSTWEKLEKFIKATNDASLKADVTKGTFTLGRMRPGILLMGFGVVLLIACIFHSFSFDQSTTRSENYGGIAAATSASSAASPAPAASPATVAKTGRNAKQTVPLSDPGSTPVSRSMRHKPSARASSGLPTVSSESTDGTSQRTSRKARVTSGRPSGHKLKLISPNTDSHSRVSVSPSALTVPALTALERRILDQWLQAVPSLGGKDLEAQMALLQQSSGDSGASVERVIQDKPVSFEQMAVLAYGDRRYSVLLRAFNTQISQSVGNTGNIPAYTPIVYLQPLSRVLQSFNETTTTHIRIAGAGREQVYQELLDMTDQILASPRYHGDLKAMWQEIGGVDRFELYWRQQTARPLAMQDYTTETDDTPELVARVKYGDRRFYKLLGFFNPEIPALMTSPKSPLPAGTVIHVFLLPEY